MKAVATKFRRCASSGFTLLELILVLGLSALCSIILFETLSFFYRSWDDNYALHVSDERIFNSLALLRSEYSLAQSVLSYKENEIRFAPGPVGYRLLPQQGHPGTYTLYRFSGEYEKDEPSDRGAVLADNLLPPPYSGISFDSSGGLLSVRLASSMSGVTVDYRCDIYPRTIRRGPAP